MTPGRAARGTVGWRLWLGMLALVLWLGASPARAQDTDYLPDNVEWNGLSELASLCSAAGKRLRQVETLDWSRVPARAAILLLYPTTTPDPEAAIAFLKRGGRLVVADDFGQGAALLETLGITRSQALPPSGAIRLFRRNPNLPLALPARRADPLTTGIREVVTNHPAFFTSRLPALLALGDGRYQVLLRGEVGSGQIIALSDPSVLINSMMAFEGNRRLARNLAALLSDSDGDLLLLTADFRAHGQVGAADAAAQKPSAAVAFLDEFNGFLGDLNDYAVVDAGLRALVVMAAGFLLLCMALLLPLPRRDMDGHWVRAAGSDPTTMEDEVMRFGRRRGVSAAYPAALLREEVEEILEEVLATPGPLSTIHPRWVVRKVREHAGEEAARVCARLLTGLRHIPHAAHATEQPMLRGINVKELRLLYEQSRRLMDLLSVDPHKGFPSRR